MRILPVTGRESEGKLAFAAMLDDAGGWRRCASGAA
jgi:hypothetical protein